MLLQIDTTSSAIAQSHWSYSNHYLPALLFVTGMLSVFLILKRSQKEKAPPATDETNTGQSNPPIPPVEKYSGADLSAKPIPVANVEVKPDRAASAITEKAPAPDLAQSLRTDKQIPSPIEKSTLKQNVPLEKRPKIIEVKLDPSSSIKKIGYTPINYLQSDPVSYPIVVMPKPTAIATIPIEGRSGKKGYKEADFKKHLTMFFSGHFQILDNRIVPIQDRDIPCSPDFSLINWKNGMNMFIDIEIDEPYEGTNNISTRRPLHYQGVDNNRNKEMTDNGWIVIRFAEIQIHQYPLRCCSFLADIVSQLDPHYVSPASLKEAKPIDRFNKVLLWTKEEAEKMSNEKYREKYLGIDRFGDIEEENLLYKISGGKGVTETKVTENKSKPVEKQRASTIASLPKSDFVIKKENESAELIPYRKGTKWGYSNRDKKILIDCVYYDAWFFDGDLALVNLNKRWCFIDKSGNPQIQLDTVKPFPFSDGLSLVKTIRVRGSYGSTQWAECDYIDLSGNSVVKRACQDSRSFTEGLAAVKENGKWGFIDKKGELKIGCIYDSVDSFEKGIAKVKRSESLIYINKEGKEVKGYTEKPKEKFVDSFKIINANGKFGFIDENQQQIIPCKYERVDNFMDNGLAIVHYRNKWGNWNVFGLIDKQGTEYWEGKYWETYGEALSNGAGIDSPF